MTKKTDDGMSLDERILSDIENNIDDSIQHTSQWSTNQSKWHKLRMRIKKAKSFPFAGCSNIRMPTAEVKIRKLKAALYNVIFGIRPVVQAIPSPSGNLSTAMKIEKWLDHLICDIIKIKRKAIIAIDQECEKGFYLLKPYWRTEISTRMEEMKFDDLSPEEVMMVYDVSTTPEDIRKMLIDRFDVDMTDLVVDENMEALDKAIVDIMEAKNNIKMTVKDVVYNYPDVALVSPERCYVPSDSGFDPQSCRFIVHEMFRSIDEIKSNIEKGWDEVAIAEIEDYKGVDESTLTDAEKDFREGIQRINNTSNLVKIWEYYGYYDINEDGIPEKCVITIAPDFDKVLRKITLPFYSGQFPFVKLAYEFIDDRWFSHRGIPEIIEDIIKEIDTQHMQKIDQQTIRNAPMFVYRAGMVNPNLVQFIPNQGIPVNGMNGLRDTIDVLNNNNPNVEYSYEREQMLLESKVEELIGQVDYTLQSMINKRQPRTLGEVQLQNQNMQVVFSLDAEMHSEAFSDLFNWIWELWCQYGNDQEEFSYFGENGWERIRISKEEVQGKYKITVRGNDQNTNPQVKLQKAQQVLMAITNPLFLQTGVINPQNIANGLKRFYQTLDIPNWEELLNTNPQPQQPPPPMPAQFTKPKFEDLTDAEKAQVLASMNVQPDAQGRMLNKQAELHEMEMEMNREPTEQPS